MESIDELVGMEGDTVQLQQIYRFDLRGRRGRLLDGRHVATGTVPRAVERLSAKAIEMPTQWFQVER